MNEEQARAILGDAIHADGRRLACLGPYMAWSPEDNSITLDDTFTLEEIEAIAWWMRNFSVNKETHHAATH